MIIARDMDFSKPKGKARDAPTRGRLSANSREFDLREAKAGSVSADELLRRRQQERVREKTAEKTPEADPENLRGRRRKQKNGIRFTNTETGISSVFRRRQRPKNKRLLPRRK